MDDKRQNTEWNDERICDDLRKAAELEEIPRSLKPEQMKKKLEESGSPRRKYHWWYGTAAAACLALVVLAAGINGVLDVSDSQKNTEEQSSKSTGNSGKQEDTTYEKIYERFSKQWEKEKELSALNEESRVYYDKAESSGAEEDSISAESQKQDYGKTNQQEQEVEEADIIKNDGRYLYQVISSSGKESYSVRITDTKNGLKEKACVGKFDNIHEIYVCEEKLIVFETGYTQVQEVPKDDAGKGVVILDDVAYPGNSFCMIHIYDISNKGKPKEIHTFHIKGNYRDSRISDGYLYFFGTDYARMARDKREYRSYLPVLEDEVMEAESIYLPEEAVSNSYLIMASISLKEKEPDKFKDSKAIVTGASNFYVSEKNIYVTDSLYEEARKEGKHTNRTKIYRFSYDNGKIEREAEGSVKGILQDDMAINEYQGYLRLVTTVDAYQVEQVTDDFWGQDMGYQTTDHETWNGLYVLDGDLKVSGKIEHLAKGEQIYSARFLGDAGYFVTFRQVDPLFSVDLSDPKKPEVLGELKISGFSEYLHFYGKDLLLGIGMEADEEDGSTQGMKLSMFDISDPANVEEKSRLNLPEYDSSTALYDYKSVLIDPQKNLFGFLAESYGEDIRYDYLLFTYEDGKFIQKMKIDCSDYDGDTMRGTYIGDSFYLLYEDGRIQEYSLKDGSRIGELKP